jgi:hypothetical protein
MMSRRAPRALSGAEWITKVRRDQARLARKEAGRLTRELRDGTTAAETIAYLVDKVYRNEYRRMVKVHLRENLTDEEFRMIDDLIVMRALGDE